MSNKRAAIFSGWGVPATAGMLNGIVPDSFQKFNIDYAGLVETPSGWDEVAEKMSELFAQGQPELAIGWSLGGQILGKLVADGVADPEHLVIISSPFHLISDARFDLFRQENLSGDSASPHKRLYQIHGAGWSRDDYEKFRQGVANLDKDAVFGMVKSQFASSVANGMPSKREDIDLVEREFISRVENTNPEHLRDWKGWIDISAELSFFEHDKEPFKDRSTLVVYTGDDLLSPRMQGQLMVDFMENAGADLETLYFDNGAHAPFILHEEEVKQGIVDLVNRERGLAAGGAGPIPGGR